MTSNLLLAKSSIALSALVPATAGAAHAPVPVRHVVRPTRLSLA